MFPNKKEQIEELLDFGEDQVFSLVIYNDDYNTFEHVIETLVRVCKHDEMQAEQCAYIVHFTGKCDVKKGNMEILKPMRNSIRSAGIKVAIL